MTDEKADKDPGEGQSVGEAENLLADFARQTESVEIAPGRFVECRAVGLSARLALSQRKRTTIDAAFASLVAYGCPVFEGVAPDDLEARLDPGVLQALGSKIMDLSGMGADNEAEAEKNSESDPS